MVIIIMVGMLSSLITERMSRDDNRRVTVKCDRGGHGTSSLSANRFCFRFFFLWMIHVLIVM